MIAAAAQWVATNCNHRWSSIWNGRPINSSNEGTNGVAVVVALFTLVVDVALLLYTVPHVPSPLSPSCVCSSNSMVKERMTSTLLYAADSNLKVEGLAMGSCRFDNRGNLNKLIHQVKNTYSTCGCWSWFDCSQYCLTDV